MPPKNKIPPPLWERVTTAPILIDKKFQVLTLAFISQSFYNIALNFDMTNKN